MKTNPRLPLDVADALRAIMRPLLSLRCPRCESPVVTPEHIDERANNGTMAFLGSFRMRTIEEPTEPMKRRLRKRRRDLR